MPFRYGIKHSELINKIDLQEDIPSICAQKLKYNQVQIGLVPVALLPELDHYTIITDYCIGTNGKVDSVKLYSMVPLSDIRSVMLDYQSRSSITLTKILAKFFWKQNFDYTDAKPGYEQNVNGSTAAVVIGDRTFALNGTFKYEYDLAEEWKKFTGLPFVFAAWVTTSSVSVDFVNEFSSALKNGVANTQKAIAESNIKDTVGLNALDYLTNKINYDLDPDKKKALTLFLEYIGKL